MNKARTKAAIAHFLGDAQMWQEAMWEMRCCYVEVEIIPETDFRGKTTMIKVMK